MSTALIVGVDSLIGAALADALIARGTGVVGTTRRARSGAPGSRMVLDLAAPDAGAAQLPRVDVAIVCAAMARFVDCREQPELARRVNVSAPAALAARLVANGTRVVLLSTSAVFDCRSPRVPADRPTSPATAYGALKAEAEAAILALGPHGCVLRLTKVITPAMPLFVAWIGALRKNERIEAFDDLRFSPIAVCDVLTALLAVLADGGGGIYQVSGAHDISYADAARHLARRSGVSPDLVRAVRAVDRGVPESEVTRYTSLDAVRLCRLTGWTPPPATDVLDAAFEHLLSEKRVASAASSRRH
jgi:dTDP-4-dehydrorhamnose reductase